MDSILGRPESTDVLGSFQLIRSLKNDPFVDSETARPRPPTFFPFRFTFCRMPSPFQLLALFQALSKRRVVFGKKLRRIKRDRKMFRQSYLKYAGYKMNEIYDGLPRMLDEDRSRFCRGFIVRIIWIDVMSAVFYCLGHCFKCLRIVNVIFVE